MCNLLQQDYKYIIDKIREQTGLSEEEINNKVNEKLEQLSGLISKEGAANIIANELGVKLFVNSGKVKDILPGMRSVELFGKVTQVFKISEFTRQDGSTGKVGSFLAGDETGIVRVVCWGRQADILNQVSEGTIIRIKGALAKQNDRGYLEVHVSERARVIINPEGETVEAVMSTTVERKKLNELTEQDLRVEVFGTITQVFDPVYYEVCSICGKRIKEVEGVYNCQEHGSVTPEYRYVMNVYLDDGNGTLRVVLFQEQAQKLLKKTNEEMLEYRNNPSSFENFKTELLGEQYKFIGRVKKNEVLDRLELVAYDSSLADAKEELARLQDN